MDFQPDDKHVPREIYFPGNKLKVKLPLLAANTPSILILHLLPFFLHCSLFC